MLEINEKINVHIKLEIWLILCSLGDRDDDRRHISFPKEIELYSGNLRMVPFASFQH